MTLLEALNIYIKYEIVIISVTIFMHLLSILFSEKGDRMPLIMYPFMIIFSTILFIIVIYFRYFNH